MKDASRRKLIGLLGQLGHENENVRAAAGAAADRIVRENKLTWEQVVFPDAPAPIADRMVPANLKELIMAAAEGCLSDWEEEFVDSMRESVRKYGAKTRVSPKQREILRRLATQAGYSL